MKHLMVMLATLLLAVGAASAQATKPESANLIRRDAAVGTDGKQVAPTGPSIERMLLSLTAVLALIVLLAWASRRLSSRKALGQASRAIQVLGRTSVSPKQKLLVVQVGRRVLVLGENGQSLTTLCEITEPDEAAALIGQMRGDPNGKSFSSALNTAMDRFDSVSHAPPRDSDAANEELRATRQELSGLMQRVRVMTSQIDRA